MQKKQTQLSIIFAVSVIIILIGAFWLQLQYLMGGDWGIDEGYYLLVAHLAGQGFKPYQEIYMSEPPVMLWSIVLPLKIFGSIWGMRFAMACFNLIAITATIWLGRLLNGKVTALIAGGLLAFNYSFFGSTRGVDSVIPSLSLALVAMGAALYYKNSGTKLWLAFSAVAMAASLLVKIYMLAALAMITLTLIFHPLQKTPYKKMWARLWQEKGRFLKEYVIWGSILVATILIIYAAYGFSNLMEQTVLFHLQKGDAHPRDLGFNLSMIWSRLAEQPFSLLLLGAYGLVRSIYRFRKIGWFFWSWTLFTFLFLMALNPLRGKHLLLIYPLLSLLAATALSHLWRLGRRQTLSPQLKWGSRIAAPVVTGLLLLEMAVPFQKLAKPVKPLIDEDKQPIVEALQKFTSPQDCIITDDPYIAIAANRMPPPWLSGITYARFESGSLNTQILIDFTNDYDCQVVVPTFSRLKNSSRTYHNFAKAHYLRVWVVNGAEIMLGKPLTKANPTTPHYTNFNNQVELLGLDWVKSENNQSGQAYISTYWKKLPPPFEQNYKIFIQLRNAAGQTVASADHEMFDGLVPTQTWRGDTIVKDTIKLDIPKNMAPGRYTLYVGLYNPASLERLPVINDVSGENAAVIPDIIIP